MAQIRATRSHKLLDWRHNVWVKSMTLIIHINRLLYK